MYSRGFESPESAISSLWIICPENVKKLIGTKIEDSNSVWFEAIEFNITHDLFLVLGCLIMVG
jgi:hypothetical protein